MAQAVEKQNGRGKPLYERTVLGFRNYWYPACLDKDVKERKPKAMMLLGDEVVFLRRQGKVYALADECPHRGTRLSRGKREFPDTPTISCRYHGWTYDVTNGNCVAALTDGPDSPVVGKVRVKTYPVEVRKGIVWVWMGRMAPVPLEEDVPPLVLRDDTWLNTRAKLVYGNWRYHMRTRRATPICSIGTPFICCSRRWRGEVPSAAVPRRSTLQKWRERMANGSCAWSHGRPDLLAWPGPRPTWTTRGWGSGPGHARGGGRVM